METSTPPPPVTNLSAQLYLQLVYTLTDLLPPLDGSPGALRARNHAAIAKVASMQPINANGADLAPSFACSVAQSIAARAQAEDILRLLRENAGDLALVIQLNAQYGSMVRTSLSAHGRLMRVQAVRQKEAIEGTANQDAWTQHVAEQSMLQVVNPDIEQLEAASPRAAPAEVSKPAPVAAPTRHANQTTAENVSENDTNPHEVASETWMSEQPWNQGPEKPDETGLHKRPHETMAGSRLAGRELHTDGRESFGGLVLYVG
jgi:hypothetical protein